MPNLDWLARPAAIGFREALVCSSVIYVPGLYDAALFLFEFLHLIAMLRGKAFHVVALD
jgi:hypothetical protein